MFPLIVHNSKPPAMAMAMRRPTRRRGSGSAAPPSRYQRRCRPDIPPLWQPKEKWFHLSKGSMLVLYRSSAVSIVDIHSKTMEKVMDCFLPLFKDQMNRTAVPYEMDLVDFFMLQLGGPRSTGSSG
jgi:hypothetical protein